MTLREKIASISDEWWHSDGEETFYSAALDLIAHGYSEDEAVALLIKLHWAVAAEYGE